MKKLELKKETVTILEKDAMNAYMGMGGAIGEIQTSLQTQLGAPCYESRLESYCHFSPCSGFMSCNTGQKYCSTH